MGTIKVNIVERWEMAQIEMWVFEQDGERTNVFSTDGDLIIRTTVEGGKPIEAQELKPLLRLPMGMGNEIFDAILKYQAESGGKTKNEHRVEGELIATKEHLSDMREFAKILLTRAGEE